MRRFTVVATLLLAVGVAFYFWQRVERSTARAPANANVTPPSGPGSDKHRPLATTASEKAAGASGPGATRPAAVTVPSLDADFPIAAALNAPTSTIARDLEILQQLFDAWVSNFPRDGNPVGENAEITAALMGENRLGLALIPKDHRALNEHGELCDRWGTPFRFHQLSGTKMEVRSAGPDRKFATEDDSIWTPP